MEELLRFEEVEYCHTDGRGNSVVIKNASGQFYRGRIYGIIGQSEAEKAVLLSLLSGLRRPDKGVIYFMGRNIEKLGMDLFRKKNAGLLLQGYPCIPHISALENAMLPFGACGVSRKESIKRTKDLLIRAGLDPAKNHTKASGLSFIEQQAVSLVRALNPEPSLLLIEEKAWNSEAGLEHGMMELLLDAAHGRDACVVIATNTRSLLDMADEVWGIKQGVLLPLKTI